MNKIIKLNLFIFKSKGATQDTKNNLLSFITYSVISIIRLALKVANQPFIEYIPLPAACLLLGLTSVIYFPPSTIDTKV